MGERRIEIIIDLMGDVGSDPASILKVKKVKEINKDELLAAFINLVLTENPHVTKAYLEENSQECLLLLIGRVMSLTYRRADEDLVRQVLELYRSTICD